MKLLYIGYLGFENVGDEVCYEACLQIFERWFGRDYSIIDYQIKENKSLSQLYNEVPFDGVILGGGSLFQGEFCLDLLEEAIEFGLPIYSFGTGVDYLSENMISSCIKKQKIVKEPFFQNKRIDIDKLKHVLKHVNFIGVRGPLTQTFLKSLNVETKSPITVIGDPALLFSTNPDTYIKETYVKHIDKPIIAINWGTTFDKMFGYNEAALQKQLLSAMNDLRKKGYHLVIYPMWPNDQDACQQLYNQMETKEHVTLIPEVCSATQIYSFLKSCFFTVNLKLHSNVLSAAARTPFISLAYRSKCVDFSMSVASLNTTILTNTNRLRNYINLKEKQISKNRNFFVRKIAKSIQHYENEYKTFIQDKLK
ncbi:polysaccharide pyruvyl transferase family protein [Bacillus alkalicellulosilyticus]|uniref:polysaccharide pyruvyl transferase family protein n=1 Tax=Alkalihalobacterium alkalicellulosilyticum TaxID=1912214 RepID=UPI0009984286|nr:polysaccharide pyruvyl transferase family protein [Bacillus alkalicellulosilyticus]